MGVLDYRKTWQFSVAAPTERCLQAFSATMSKTNMGIGAMKWRLARTNISPDLDGSPRVALVATLAGRAGLGMLLNVSPVIRSMTGAQITFAIHEQMRGGRSQCAMWLSLGPSFMDIPIADIMFLRNYMNDVEQQLRALDPRLTVDKG